MKNIVETNKRAQNIQAIKDDMKDIVKRVSSLKGESLNALYESSEDLMSYITELENKISKQGQGIPSKICACIEKNPLKSSLYAFGAGVTLGLILRNKKCY